MAGQGWRTEKIRRPRSELQWAADQIAAHLESQGVEFHFGGSYARSADSVGDIDVVIVTPNGQFVPDLTADFEPVSFPPLFEAQRSGDKIAQGDHPLSPDSEDKVHVDFWACSPQERGGFLMFIRGPKELNVAQRSIAISKGYNLSQVGLFKGGETVKGKLVGGEQVDNGTEEHIYELLGLQYLTPEQRESFAAPKDNKEVQTRLVDGSKGKKYEVKVQGRRVSCSCPGYTFRKNCKHADAVRAEL